MDAGCSRDVIEPLHEALADEVQLSLLAERGFGVHKPYAYLERLGCSSVIHPRLTHAAAWTHVLPKPDAHLNRP